MRQPRFQPGSTASLMAMAVLIGMAPALEVPAGSWALGPRAPRLEATATERDAIDAWLARLSEAAKELSGQSKAHVAVARHAPSQLGSLYAGLMPRPVSPEEGDFVPVPPLLDRLINLPPPRTIIAA